MQDEPLTRLQINILIVNLSKLDVSSSLKVIIKVN